MAKGDKLPVVMGKEKAVPGGVATLGADGILAESQRPTVPGKNLLINSDFRKPVNRNGKTEYTSTGYTIDRWRLMTVNASLTVLSDKIRLSCKNKTNINTSVFEQRIWSPEHLIGRQTTLSWLVDEIYGDATWELVIRGVKQGQYVGAYTKVIETGLNCFTITVPSTWDIDELDIRINVRNENSEDHDYIDMIAAFFEEGDHQTHFRQNADGEWEIIDPPDYDLQYLLCSQYSPVTGEWVGVQHSNQNLLDNPYHQINQRNITQLTFGPSNSYNINTTNNTNLYIDDRWFVELIKNSAGTITVQEEKITFSVTNYAGYIQLLQKMEASILKKENVYTLSMMAQSSGKFHIGIGKASMDSHVSSIFSNVDGVVSTTSLNGGSNSNPYGRAFAQIDSVGTFVFGPAKLELGPVQTLAHKEGDTWVLNDPPPNLALELIKCYKYQISLIDYAGSYGGALGFGRSHSNNLVWIYIPAALKMRINPALNFLSGTIADLGIMINGNIYKPSNTTNIIAKQNGVIIGFSIENVPINQPAILYAVSSCRPILNANL